MPMAEQQADSLDETGARLKALRESGANRFDQVRLAYLEALARRSADQPEAVRQPLLNKLTQAADTLAARLAASPSGTPEQPESSPSALADLLAYISQHPLAQSETVASAAGQRPPRGEAKARTARGPELKSIAYFRNTWSKLSTEQQLTQTLAQAPENAGPMNSQHLVLRALQAMRDISPDYLQGFMSYIDTLIWLEQANPVKPHSSRSSIGDETKRAAATKRHSGKR